MDHKPLLMIIMITVAITGLVYALFYDKFSKQDAAAKRKAQFQKAKNKNDVARTMDQNKRKQQIIDSIKDADSGSKQKKRKTAATLIGYAGLEMTTEKFYIMSASFGVVCTIFTYAVGHNIWAAGGMALAGGLGFPRWILSYIAKRRTKKFLEAFPGAVDVIIRGVKAGLPLGQTLAIIAAEAVEPVRTEFRLIVEAQSVGLTISEAVDRLPERINLTEANFFAIVINLQQKSGGNLSEALGNLSLVLRERKKIRLKIQAMSSEAKSSAAIIGALPFIIGLLLYILQPGYIMLLFTNPTGQTIIMGCLMWMAMGIFVMKKMINFDF